MRFLRRGVLVTLLLLCGSATAWCPSGASPPQSGPFHDSADGLKKLTTAMMKAATRSDAKAFAELADPVTLAIPEEWFHAVNLLRAERRRAARESPAGAEPDTMAGHEGDRDAALWVRRAVEQLDEGDREILLLRGFEQLRYDEIAALLRLPVNTVRSRLFLPPSPFLAMARP